MTKNLPIADTAAVFGEEAKDQRRQSDVYTLKHCFVSVKNSFVAAHLYRSDTPVDTPTNLPCSYAQDMDQQGQSLGQILSNMRLLSDGLLTVSGILLFGRDPQALQPVFHIKAVCYPGNDIHTSTYLDSANIYGRIQTQFEESLSFILRNLRREQRGQGVNTTGEVEIPRIVFEELLANALIHRDYFVYAPIRIFVFDDRIEIISPGYLPNNLTVANIQTGNSNIRNPISLRLPPSCYRTGDSALGSCEPFENIRP